MAYYSRLSRQDTMFLHLEGARSPMHAVDIEIFGGGPISHAEGMQQIGSRLHLTPLRRKKLAKVPFNLGRPVWVDDTDFDLANHVRHVAIPSPGTEAQLLELAARICEQPLVRTRPLWEVSWVESVAGDRCALINKFHHCTSDGVTLIAEMELQHSRDPLSPIPDALPWAPEPGPSRVGLLLGALRDNVREIRALEHGTAAAVARSLRHLASVPFRPSARSPLKVRHHGPHRVAATATMASGDVRAVRRALGGTFNDVITTAITGGLRSWLLARGERVHGLVLRTGVPVNTRDEGEFGGNRVAATLADLPVGEEDAVRRLEIVRASMDAAKASEDAKSVDIAIRHVPGGIVAGALKLQSYKPVANLGVTNVRGMSNQTYYGGRPFLGQWALAPLILPNLSLAIAVISYNTDVCVGLLADADVLPDVGLIAEGIEKSMQELVRAAV